MPTVEELGNEIKARYPKEFGEFPSRRLGQVIKQRNPSKYADYEDRGPVPGTEQLGFSPPSPPPLKVMDVEEVPRDAVRTVAEGAYGSAKEPVQRFVQHDVVRPVQQGYAGLLEGSADFYNTAANAAELVGVATGTTPGGAFRGTAEGLARRAEAYGAPQNLGEKIMRGTGSAIPAIAKYALGSRAGGPVAGMAMTEAVSAADKGPAEMLKGAGTGAAMGGTLKVISPARALTRVSGGAALGGSQAAAAGGDLSDVIAGGVTFGGLLAPGGRGMSFREARRDPFEPIPLKGFPEPAVPAPTEFVGGSERGPLQPPLRQVGGGPPLSPPLMGPARPYGGEPLRPPVGKPSHKPTVEASPLEPPLRIAPLKPPDAGPARKGTPNPATESAEILKLAPPRAAVESARAFTRPERELGPLASTIPERALGRAPRREGQRGSVSGRRASPPDPDIQYARDLIEQRKNALKKSKPTIRERAVGRFDTFLNQMMDNQFGILRKHKRGQGDVKSKDPEGQYELLESEKYDNPIDRTKRAGQIANSFMEDNGLVRSIEALRNEKELELFDEYLRIQQTETHLRRRPDLIDSTGRAQEATYEEIRGEYAIPGGRPPDRASDQKFVAKTQARFEPVAEQVYEYSRRLVDYATEAGLISGENAGALKQYPWVPMRRAVELIGIDDAAIASGGYKQIASQRGQSLVKEMRGSRGLPSLPPLETLMRLTRATVLEAERNKAAGVIGRKGRRIGAESNPEKDALPGWEDVSEVPMTDSYKNPNGHFYWRENGKTRAFKAPRHVVTAVKALDEVQIRGVERIAAIPARITKAFTTGPMNPQWLAVNLAYDLPTALVQADAPVRQQIKRIPASLGEALANTKGMRELTAKGGGFSFYDYLRDSTEFTYENILALRDVRRLAKPHHVTEASEAAGRLAKHAAKHPIESAGELYRAFEELSAATERAGRLRVYESAKQHALDQGRNTKDAELIALRESNNALPNYLRKGDLGRLANVFLLYFNPGVQGLRSFWRAVETKPTQTASRALVQVGLPMAAAVAYNLMNDERREAYGDLQDYEKNDIVIVRDPKRKEDGTYDVWTLPLAPGPLETVGRATREGMEALFHEDPVKFRDVADMLVGLSTPFEARAGSVASSLTPHAIKIPAEWHFNRDFYRESETVPKWVQQFPVAQQTRPYTPGTARAIGESTGTPPAKVHQAARGLLGGGTDTVLHYADKALAAVGLIPEEQVKGTSVGRSFAKRFLTARGRAKEKRDYEMADQLSRDVLEASVSSFMTRPVLDELTNNGVGFGGTTRKDDETDADFAVRSALRVRVIDRFVSRAIEHPKYKASTDARKRTEFLRSVRNAATRAASDIYDDMDDGAKKGLLPPFKSIIKKQPPIGATP